MTPKPALDIPVPQPSPLADASVAHIIIRRSPASKLPRLRRLLVRLCYLRCEWTSDYSSHTMGVYTDFDAAERDAGARAVEDRELWQIHTVPINSLLPNDPVRFGEFSAINAAELVGTQDQIQYEAVRSSEVQRLRTAARQLSEILSGQRRATTL